MSEQTSVEVMVSPEQTPEQRVATLESQFAALMGQLEAVTAKLAAKTAAKAVRAPSVGSVAGMSPTVAVKALTMAGWSEKQISRLLAVCGAEVSANTLATSIRWGKCWGNLTGAKGHEAALAGKCGKKPPVLSEEQLAELVRVRDGVVEEVAVTDGMREAFGLVA